MDNFKKELRLEAKGLLKDFSEKELLEGSEKISRSLLSLLDSLDFKILGGYCPIETEVRWNTLFQDTDFLLAFPSIEDEGLMDFYQTKSSSLKSIENFGKIFLEPDKSLCPKVIPEIQIVPGLLFDRNGNRLGRGKGYYDRYLSKHKSINIGVCFQKLLVEKVLVDHHDIQMDFVITENELIKIDRSK